MRFFGLLLGIGIIISCANNTEQSESQHVVNHTQVNKISEFSSIPETKTTSSEKGPKVRPARKKEPVVDVIATPDTQVVAVPAKSIANIADHSFANDFALSVRVNQDSYKIGDDFKIYITSEKNCYIEVYNLNAQGEVTLVFPIENLDNSVVAGKEIAIPKGDEAFFEIVGPRGKDRVIVLANTKDSSCLAYFLKNINRLSTSTAKGNAKGFRTKIISATKMEKAKRAMAVCEFTTE